MDDDRLICTHPFEYFEVTGSDENRGAVFTCCPTWLDVPLGHLLREPVDEIWNGATAQKLRRSILDGSFEYCSRARCPFLETKTGPVRPVGRVEDPEVRRAIAEERTVLPYGPRFVHLSYDRSCNLSCPSCRTGLIMESDERDEIQRIEDILKRDVLNQTVHLYVTGSGDPFGSPFFFRLLRTLDPAGLPHLAKIELHSNGLLWNERNWLKIPEAVRARVKRAHISIDAATPETYAVNRRGGDFAQLLGNLDGLAALRREGPLERLIFSMVVQENNFREMPAFVELGRRFGVDFILFSYLVNWGTFSDGEYRARSIHMPEHARHGELRALIADPRLDGEDVFLGSLASLRAV